MASYKAREGGLKDMWVTVWEPEISFSNDVRKVPQELEIVTELQGSQMSTPQHFSALQGFQAYS